MKNFLIVLVVIAAMGCAERVYTTEISEREKTGDWLSFIVEDDRPLFVRMVTKSFEASNLLVIDYYPGRCETARMFLILPGEKENIYGAGVSIPGRLRVDRNSIINISYRGRVNGEYFDLGVEGVTEEDLLQGDVVRFQVGTSKEGTLSSFPLSGFAAAYKRTRTLCPRLRDAAAEYF